MSYPDTGYRADDGLDRTDPALQHELVTYLNTISAGHTADTFAAWLGTTGAIGELTSADKDALANHLYTRFPNHGPEVSDDYAFLYDRGRAVAEVELPAVLQEFIAGYDAGRYPWLVDTGTGQAGAA
jgi:hypothetical protein